MHQSSSLAGGDCTDSLDEWSDLCSDYEDELRADKRKKSSAYGIQPHKKSRLNTAVREVSSPSDSSVSTADLNTRRASPQRAARAINQNITADAIYTAVFSGKGAMVSVVDEWLDTYKQSREQGLLELVNFLVQSCGCKGVVTEEMFSSQQHAEIISTLTKEFNEDSVNYPLSAPGPQLKRFKANLCEFAKVLVRSCRNSLVFDEYLFPSLLALLTGLSDSQVRAFRHTSTLLAVKLMTGLVEVAAHLSVQIQTLQRRYDVEISKTALEKNPERMEELHLTLNELHDHREELSSIMNATFRGVFVHRYRDKLPEIRAACIEEMGMWLKTDPEDFLNDGCLKYLGWTLNDKHSPVRVQCVRALQGLYQEKEFIGRLELFTSRFKERILSMVQDKEPDVALEVVHLLLLIQQNTEEGLSESECGLIYPLVYASHRALACAAASFLYHRMEGMAAAQTGPEKGAAFIQMVMAFHIQCEFHEHGTYLVDSLWDVAGAELRSWDAMTALLIHKNGILDEEESALIEIMVCAVQRASQASPPVGRSHGRKILSVKDKKIQDQDRSRITAHFVPLLPQLLAKYSADAAKVTLLLKVPLCFDLELFSSAQGHLEQLLAQVCEIVEKHRDGCVLEACAHLVSTLCSDRHTLSSRAHTAFSQLLDTLSDCFNSYLSELLKGSADEEDVYHAAVALKRIGALSCAKDPTPWKLFDGCLQLLSLQLETTHVEVEVELKVSALKCAAFHLMWAKVNTVTSSPKQAEMKILKREVRSFCKVCQSCLSVTAAEIREQAFELLCDLLLLFSETSVRSEPALQTLVLLPSDSLRSEMAAFLVDYVFTDDEELSEVSEEEKITRLQKKRNQLAGFCKLVMYGVLDLTAATDVFKHYSKYFKDYGDIIKEVISKSKLINPVLSAKTVCLSLQQLFSEMLTEEQSKQAIGEIRDLAKKLAMSFGIDLHRARKPLMALHNDGVSFAFRVSADEELQNVAFLEILSEFSFKLLLQDRTQLASQVKSQCPSAALCWSSVRMYLRSLETRSKPKDPEEGLSRVTSAQNSPVPKRKRSTANASMLDSIDSSLTPLFSSTVLKEPSKALGCGDLRGLSSEPLSEDHRGLSSEPLSEDQFSSSRPTLCKDVPALSTRHLPTVRQTDLNSHLTLLSLIDDVEEEEEEEPDIEDCDSSNTSDSQVLTTPSALDVLFD